MAKESRGFFERLTGTRLMSREEKGEELSDAVDLEEDEILYEDEVEDIDVNDEDEQDEDEEEDEEEYLDEAIEEEEPENEETFSDESTGQADQEEQEGQLTVDVFQDDTNVVIQSTIAGVAPDDLDVSITNDMVTIRGERRRTFDVTQEDYFYQECYWGTFSRSIILPVEIDADRAEAKIKNGIMTIRIPKTNAAMTRKLKVKAS